jgi:hypothetical protein
VCRVSASQMPEVVAFTVMRLGYGATAARAIAQGPTVLHPSNLHPAGRGVSSTCRTVLALAYRRPAALARYDRIQGA